MVRWHYYRILLLSYLIITGMYGVLQHCFWLVLVEVCTTIQCFCLLKFFLCPCMAINVGVQYNGGLLLDIILLTQCYYHRGTRLNAMKRFCLCSL